MTLARWRWREGSDVHVLSEILLYVFAVIGAFVIYSQARFWFVTRRHR